MGKYIKLQQLFTKEYTPVLLYLLIICIIRMKFSNFPQI